MADSGGGGAGPARFECPVEFSASPFAPGPPFSAETLQDPSKQLLLIRAPAHFSPESLDGHAVSLSGFQTLKVVQPDGKQKVYSIQTTPGELGSCAHLLIPSGHLDRLTCAPPFSGSLSIWERYGDPSATQPLLPVAARPAPQIPEGLKQRFLPFGAQLKRPPPLPQEATEKPPRKKKRKHLLQMLGYMGDPEEQLPLKSEPWVGGGPEVPSGEATVLAEDSQPSSNLGASSQESLLSAEEASHKRKKRKKLKEEPVEEKELLLLNPSYTNQQSELKPRLLGELEPHAGESGSSGMEGLVQRKHKKKRRHEEKAAAKETVMLMDLASIKEEAVTEPEESCGLGGTPEGSPVLAKEEPETGHTTCESKRRRRKKKAEKHSEEQEAGRLLIEPSSIKQELLDCDELEARPGPGVGLGDSLDATMQVPGQKHKKKKKKHKREAAEEGLGFIKQEPKDPQE